eukprot:383172_1
MSRFEGCTSSFSEPFFKSRRSPVLSRYGMVCSSQPLVSQIGQSILKDGGNAIDASVAMNFALAVVEPFQTGLGGDCFSLYYNSSNKQVYGLNGSGRSPSNLTYHNFVKQLKKTTSNAITDPKNVPMEHALNITVPGNVDGMLNILNKFGTMSKEKILLPAIKLAENGWCVSPMTSYRWQKRYELLYNSGDNYYELLMPSTKKAPLPGDIMYNKYIANSLKKIMVYGRNEFYNGSIADAIINCVSNEKNGGLLTKNDLKNHESEWVKPITIDYNGINIYEIPPNGQGIAALMALNFYQTIKKKNKHLKMHKIDINNLNDKYINDLHLKIECMRLSYRYAKNFVSDLSHFDNYKLNPIQIYDKYLSKNFAEKCCNNEISVNYCNKKSLLYGYPLKIWETDTASVVCVDSVGNGCSFISSNYDGTNLIPKNCGFVLHNRGYLFNKNRGHPNCIGPNKKPYHTILPGMVTRKKDGSLYCVFNCIGGWMQPQAHFQLISNLIDHGLNPQKSIDMERFLIGINDKDGSLNLSVKESQVNIEYRENAKYIVKQLINKYGHTNINIIKNGNDRRQFGRAQIIYKDLKNGCLWGASDGRADGCAIGLEHNPIGNHVSKL